MKNFLLVLAIILSSHAAIAVDVNRTSMPKIVLPPIDPYPGNQILHFSSRNKSVPDNTVRKFIEKHLSKAETRFSDAGVLRYASDSVTIKNGLFLEMGVCTGRSINFIAGLNPIKTIHGFDSFAGLPEDWNKKTWNGKENLVKKGTYAFHEGEPLPSVLRNVKIHVGLLKDTLPEFVKNRRREMIGFLHIDTNLYSSAKDIFNNIGHLIKPGTIIVFDEYYHYPACEEHEHKAFMEFIESRPDISYEFIVYNPVGEQVAARITKAKSEQ